MKAFFDTSVLIAAMISVHPKHNKCMPWLVKAKRKQITGIVSAHSLLECYSVLTRLPLSPKITPQLAATLIKENIISAFSIIVSYDLDDYFGVLESLSSNAISGRASYGAFLIATAKKEGADKILTLNESDFIRVAPEMIKYILQP